MPDGDGPPIAPPIAPPIEPPIGPPIAAPLGDVTTERLTLTRIGPADAEALTPVFAHPAVWRFPYGRGMDEAWTAGFVARAGAHWERVGFGLWLARAREDGAAIGYLGLSMPGFLAEAVGPERMPAVEVGWRLHPDHWGRGLASEGATAALREAFDTLGLREVCSAPQSINAASGRVAQRIGMTCEETVTLAATADRPAVDIDLYWITRDRWRQREAR